MYSTYIRPESELSQRKFISGKLLMTKDKGSIFVEYTIAAVVYMIYTMKMSYWV